MTKKLNERLITTPGNYGNIIIISGGAGAGKSTAIKKFFETGKYKIRDVDAWKHAFIKLGQITDRFPKFKNMSLKNPDDATAMHQFILDRGIKSKTLELLFRDLKQDRLPNLMFDITGSRIDDILDIVTTATSVGYDAKKINLVWILTDYRIALERNRARPRTVPDQVVIRTHEKSARTFLSVVDGKHQTLFRYLDGGIFVVLGEDQHTVYYDDKQQNVKDFTYFRIKSAGKPVDTIEEFNNKVLKWVKDKVPPRAFQDD